jgi:MFS family permease
MRSYGLSASETGISYGLLVGVCGLTGVLLGGFVSDFTRARDERFGLWFVAAVVAVGGVLKMAGWAAPNYGLFILIMLLPQIAFLVNVGAVFPAVQGLVAPNMRAMAVAIYLFITNGFGQASGPLLAGLMSDVLRPTFGAGSLGVGLTLLSALNLWGALHYVLAASRLRSELGEARAAHAGAGVRG